MSEKKSIIIVLVVALVCGLVFVYFFKNNFQEITEQRIENIEIRDGVQYVTIHARSGYTPQLSVAKSDIPTKLVVKTNGTYDCSLALVIRSIGYQKMLSPSGEEIIDLGIPRRGTLEGLCSMGMYSFTIRFD